MRRTGEGNQTPWRAPARAAGEATSGAGTATAVTPGVGATWTQGTPTTRGASPGLLQQSKTAARNPGDVAQQSWTSAERGGSAQGHAPISAARRAIRATAAVSPCPRCLIVDATSPDAATGVPPAPGVVAVTWGAGPSPARQAVRAAEAVPKILRLSPDVGRRRRPHAQPGVHDQDALAGA